MSLEVDARWVKKEIAFKIIDVMKKSIKTIALNLSFLLKSETYWSLKYYDFSSNEYF